MTTNITLFCIGIYIVLGLIFFATAWKRFEEEDVNFNEQTRAGRIISRLIVIVFWGAIVAGIILIGIYSLLRGLWKMITE